MKRNIPSSLIILLVFWDLSAPPCTANSPINIPQIVYISQPRTWSSAQDYCRTHYSDLVTVRSQEEADKLALYGGWIGLYYDSDLWRWSRGSERAKFFIWDNDEPDNGQECTLMYQSCSKWESDDCANLHPSLCQDDRMILVREKKTWEEAALHCRMLPMSSSNGGVRYPYTLASLPKAEDILFDRETIREHATSNQVWVGLRFLAGHWVWLNGHTVTSSYLPHCPAQLQHCGALDPKETDWKIMNCSEERNFLCIMRRNSTHTKTKNITT